MSLENDYSNIKVNNSKKYFLNYLPLIILISVFSLVFVLLEIKYPYFFCNDDNRDYFLPKFVHNYDSIINGEIPFYNFHQFLGFNYFADGQSTTFYPLTYFAVFFSKVFFGHPNATVDITVYMHLLIGGIGFYLFIYALGAGKKGALFGAIAWQLNCFTIYCSNSWYIVSAVIAYLPWIMLFNVKLVKNPSTKNLLGAIIFKLLLFYGVHIQYFVYTLLFEFFAFILFNLVYKDRKLIINRIIYYIFVNVFTFFLTLPLLLPEWAQTSISYDRGEIIGWSEFLKGKLNFLYFIKEIIKPMQPEGFYTTVNVGFLTLIFFIIAIIFIFVRNKSNSFNKKLSISFLFLFSFITVWMCSSSFNSIIYHLPILNRFRFIFKLLCFSNFFFISISAIGISQFLDWIKIRRNFKLSLYVFVIVMHILNFSILYLNTPKKTFYCHMDELPLNEPFKPQFKDDRIMTFGFTDISGGKGYTAPGLLFDYATLFGLNHFSGYEPLLSKVNHMYTLKLNGWSGAASMNGRQLPLDYLRNWGVKWYVASKEYDFARDYNFVSKYSDEKRTIYYDQKALPLFYWNKDKSDIGIEHKIKTNSIILKVKTSEEDKLGINFLYNPDFNALIDGKPVGIQSGEHYQMIVSVPEGKHIIEIKYSDPNFILGSKITLAFIALMLLLILLYFIVHKKKNILVG